MEPNGCSHPTPSRQARGRRERSGREPERGTGRPPGWRPRRPPSGTRRHRPSPPPLPQNGHSRGGGRPLEDPSAAPLGKDPRFNGSGRTGALGGPHRQLGWRPASRRRRRRWRRRLLRTQKRRRGSAALGAGGWVSTPPRPGACAVSVRELPSRPLPAPIAAVVWRAVGGGADEEASLPRRFSAPLWAISTGPRQERVPRFGLAGGCTLPRPRRRDRRRACGRVWASVSEPHSLSPSAVEFSQDDRLFSRAAGTPMLGSGKASRQHCVSQPQ